MRRLFATVGVFALVVGIAGASGEPLPPTPPATSSSAAAPAKAALQSLVDKLGSELFSEREAAEKELAKIGLPAAEALTGGLRSESPEVRERAAALLVKIRRQADSGNRLVAKRVKLDYKNIPLGTALNDLKTRTGLNISLDPNRVENPLRKITCETAEIPAWEALEAFCVAAGLREVFLSELDAPKPSGNRRGYVPPPVPPMADAVPIVLVDGKPQKIPGERSTAVR